MTQRLPGQVYCFACGGVIDARAEICPHCGVRQRPPPSPAYPYGRSRTTAALLAIFLGTFGIHKFYLGKTAQGILYLVFFWTFIPGFIAFFEGIWYLTMLDHDFWERYPTIDQEAAWSVAAPSTGYTASPPTASPWKMPPEKTCPRCGESSAAVSRYCPRCGQAL